MDNKPVRTARERALIIKDGTARYEILKLLFATTDYMSTGEISKKTNINRQLILRTISKTQELGVAKISKMRNAGQVFFRLEEVRKKTQLYNKGPNEKKSLHFLHEPKPKYHLNEKDRLLWSIALIRSFS